MSAHYPTSHYLLPFHQVSELHTEFIYIYSSQFFFFFYQHECAFRVKAVLLLQHRLFLQSFVVSHA